MAKSRARNQQDMFPQKRIAQIETWINKAEAIRERLNTEKEALKNAEFKLNEALHANKTDIIVENTEDEGIVLKYERGGYKASAKHAKQTLTYTRNADAKKAGDGAAPDDEDQVALVPGDAS
jgi:hypothetical protein